MRMEVQWPLKTRRGCPGTEIIASCVLLDTGTEKETLNLQNGSKYS